MARQLRPPALCNLPMACHYGVPPGVIPCTPQTADLPYAHPARLILILSLAPVIGLGIGRFAYALVLPDMRDLVWLVLFRSRLP